MIQPWFTQEVALRFALFSLFSLFAVLDVFIDQGRHRFAVTSALMAGAATGVILLALAVVAGVGGQPAYVLLALGVPAAVLSVVFTTIVITLPRRYAVAELRRIASQEI
jgi:hypothetical protein